MDRVYNIFALRESSPGRSEVVALWDGVGWTTDPTLVKNYWNFEDVLSALDWLKRESKHRGFDAVDIFDFEYREPGERKRWHPGRSLSGYSHKQSLKLINEVRSALANLDPNDKNPAIRAALTIGWLDEEAMSEPKAKKRWGEGSPGDVLEILDGIGDQLAQMDRNDVSDIVTVGLNVVNLAVEAFRKKLPPPRHDVLRKRAIEDFKAEKGREPRLGWWEDPLSTEHPAGQEPMSGLGALSAHESSGIVVESPDDFMAAAHELFNELEDQMEIRLDAEDHGPTRDPITGDVSMLFGGADIEGMLGRQHYGSWANITVGHYPEKKRWGYRVLWSMKDNLGSPVIWKSYSKQPFDPEAIIRDFVEELRKLAVGAVR